MTQKTPAFRIALTVALVLMLVLVPAALAGKGGGKPGGGNTSGTGTIRLHPLNSTDGLVHVMQTVTFDVYTTATQYPYVTVDCYDMSGAWVYRESNGIFPTSLGQDFTLGSNIWTSGAADCTARLQNWDNYARHGTTADLASTSFHVYP